MKFLLLVRNFIVAVLTTFIAASIFHSQMVLSELSALDIEISFMDRINMTTADLAGLLPGYGSIIAIALLLGFLIIEGVNRWIFTMARWRFVLAGGLALLVALLAMHPIFNVSLIAGARSGLGIVLQGIAGALGGYAFILAQGPSKPA